MGATYTRQSSYTDGDVITAAHTNDEFNQLLAAFQASSGHTHDGTANEGGAVTKLLGNTLTFGAGTADTDITVTFDGESNDGVLLWKEDEDYFEFSDDILVASTEKLQFRDTAIYINSSTDGQLDLVADTEIQIAATTIDMNGAVDISGNLGVGGNLTVTGTTTFNGGTMTLGDAATDNVVFGADVNSSIIPNTDSTFDLGSSSQEWKDIYIDGVAYLDAINFNGTAITSTAAELNILDGVTATAAELNLVDGITAGTISASKAVIVDSNKDVTGLRNVTTTGDVVVGGDLTISGDDLTMATNTAGHLLIADGTNFNPTAVGDLSSISTVANDDVFLAVDTSGGGLKKITRSTIVSGLAIGGVALSNIVEDTSPQLGGNLDMNGADIVTTSNATLDLAPNGTGTVVVRGNTNSGAIVFNCESNSHGQTVQAQPHSASVTNTMLLPAGANSTLVSLVSTDTLTNKTLTTPTINGATIGSANIATASNGDINFAPNGTGKIVVRGNTNQGKIVLNCESNSHGQTIISAPHSESADNVLTLPSTGGDARLVSTASTATLTNKTLTSPKINEDVAVTSTATELNILDGVTSTTAELNILDGVTSTTAELNILDGVTSTAAELNILDGVTSTAAELNALDGITAVVGELNALDLGSTAVGNAIASKAVILDSNKDYTGIRNLTTTGVVTVGSQLIMPDVTSTKILVADGTSFQEVSISGDITIANTGAVTIAANAVEGSMLNDNTISGQTALTSGLASDDELLVSDGGTLKRMDVSVLTTVTDDSATALAIALG